MRLCTPGRSRVTGEELVRGNKWIFDRKKGRWDGSPTGSMDHILSVGDFCEDLTRSTGVCTIWTPVLGVRNPVDLYSGGKYHIDSSTRS